jgi:hypothetical protein
MYAEALASQALPHWIAAHVHAFEAFEGCPRIIVPEYVPGHIFRVLWPTPLCGQRPAITGDGPPRSMMVGT